MNIRYTVSQLQTLIKTPITQQSLGYKIILSIALSWIYAICSQIILPLPFNLVPLSLQPLPLLLCAEIFGWTAVHAYLLYLAQGVFGAPFFANFGHGLLHLLGPTGGYLWGFLGAMVFIAATKNNNYSWQFLLMRSWTSNIILFSCGLIQLACFISKHNLFWAGLYPFIVGDFIIKPILFIWLTKRKEYSS